MNELAESGIGQSILSAGKLSDLTTFVDELGLSGFLHPITGVSNIHAAGKKDISQTHLAKITHEAPRRSCLSAILYMMKKCPFTWVRNACFSRVGIIQSRLWEVAGVN